MDVRAQAWANLCRADSSTARGPLEGEDEATYEYASGWVLDTRAGDWLQIEPHPDESEVYDQAIATGPALSLVVFGGQSWSSDEGRLVNDMWRWTPPPAGSR